MCIHKHISHTYSEHTYYALLLCAIHEKIGQMRQKYVTVFILKWNFKYYSISDTTIFRGDWYRYTILSFTYKFAHFGYLE